MGRELNITLIVQGLADQLIDRLCLIYIFCCPDVFNVVPCLNDFKFDNVGSFFVLELPGYLVQPKGYCSPWRYLTIGYILELSCGRQSLSRDCIYNRCRGD